MYFFLLICGFYSAFTFEIENMILIFVIIHLFFANTLNASGLGK